MTKHLDLFVPGVVRGQGSLALWRGTDGTERAKYPQATVAWRNTVIHALSREWDGKAPLRGPVQVDLVAVFARPKSHFGTGRNAGVVKESAGVYMTGHQDLDKVQRLVGDALVYAGVLGDDDQVCRWVAGKFWAAADERPGALIVVKGLG